MGFTRTSLWSTAILVAGSMLLTGVGCSSDASRESLGSVQESAKKAASVVVWQPSVLRASLPVASSTVLSVKLEARDHVAATSVHVSPSLAPYVTVKPTHIPALRRGDKRSLELKVVVRGDVKPQVVKGELWLTKKGECHKNDPALCNALPIELTLVDPLAQAVSNLEATGKIPILDRSDGVGPDANANGIRDDIDDYIGRRGYLPEQRDAVEQMARVFQTMVALGTEQVSEDVSDQISARSFRAIGCLGLQFDNNGRTVRDLAHTYRKLTMNTESRVRAYENYERSREGTVSVAPQGDTCDN